MDARHEIESRMEKIRSVFQYAMSVSIDEEDFFMLDDELKAIGNEFRSVAYEAAAMRIALKDISENNAFKYWKLFMHGAGQKHLVQVHIGLGWALAQQQVSVFPFIGTLDPLMQCRVIDGYGYYEGIFRRRKAIGEKLVPPELENTFLYGYDQGIGRSIWYNCKGECEKISEIIAAFPPSRHQDLWRGIGTACAYVGGYDEHWLRKLFAAASVHHTQLSIGAALVARSRAAAGSFTVYIDMACRIWCHCSWLEASEIKTMPSAGAELTDPFKTWISNIEKHLQALAPA